LNGQETQRVAGGANRGGDQGGGPNIRGGGDPLTGEGYVNWSDRLRDVEEMIDESDLRNEVASVRERARAMRQDIRQRAMPPQWDKVQTQILAPLAEVRKRVAEELSKRQSADALVPIDRDPVPNQYSELVRKYYERLGKAD
jgi:hypothetical protein